MMRYPIVVLFILLNISSIVFTSIEIQKYKNNIELPLEIKIGQMLMIGFKGRYPDEKSIQKLKEYIEAGSIGGIIIYQRNMKNRKQTKKLISYLKSLKSPYPLLIAVDQEGGKVSRLKNRNGFEKISSAANIAATKTIDEAYGIYKKLAEDIKNIGFNLNFAPVVDLNINPDSPAIGKKGRSYSDKPDVVLLYAKSFIQALQDQDVISVIKHFPGHGSAKDDTHFKITDITNTWQNKELIPYRSLIRSETINAIMSSHIIHRNFDSIFPVSLSIKWLKNILRKSLVYDGLLITDDLQMGAISNNYSIEEIIYQALQASNDILLFANPYKYKFDLPQKFQTQIKYAIQQNKLTKQRIDESFCRIIRLKKKYISNNIVEIPVKPSI